MLVRESFVYTVAAIFFVLATDSPLDPLKEGGISNGWNAELGEFPYHALIGCVYPNETTFWFCQGAIISSRFVITTSVCVTAENVNQCTHFKIRVGAFKHIPGDPYTFLNSYNFTHWELMNVVVGVDYIANKTKPPPGFGLALLETNTQIIYSSTVQPVILPNDTDIGLGLGTELVATGFGFYHKNDRMYGLQYITLSMLNNSICTQYLNVSTLVHEYQKTDCAQAKDHYSGELRGKLCREFGSPIVLKQDNRTLVGLYDRILFWDCSNGPEFFIDIRCYIPWIRYTAGLDTLD